MTKPSIVFAHGLWADGSCFSKLIPTLQTEGHDVMASQHGLDSLATDVAAVKACLARVPSPAILVGHSYGGTLITYAGTDARVAALVYIAALAPDADETSQSLLGKFPTSPVFDSSVRPQAQSQRPNANWRRLPRETGPQGGFPLSWKLSVCNVGFWQARPGRADHRWICPFMGVKRSYRLRA